jgi:signal transduction histidine kinase/DNA-binding response OmpR family regulator
MSIAPVQQPTQPPIATIKPLDLSKFSHETFLNPEGSPLILVADDDAITRTMLCLVMETEGYQVIEAYNAQDCLEAYKLFHPDLVFLKTIMPGMDGFTCCRQLRAIAASEHTPILMMTNWGDCESVKQAFAAGATDCITKPISLALLRQRVRQLIRRTELSEQLQQLNTEVELRVQQGIAQLQERTIELQQELEFEVTLKQIGHKLRDRFDESQILQTAVLELAKALKAGSCSGALYDFEQNPSNLCHKYITASPEYQGHVWDMDICPEIKKQLKQGQYVQFCSLTPNPVLGQVAMIACPIIDNQGLVGHLWLINPKERLSSELQIRLVQQVAGECALAIRRTRLYQAQQARIAELEKLNELKEDFINTVTHELRSPLSGIRLTIQMLQQILPLGRTLCGETANHNAYCGKCVDYLQILSHECEREISLLNDLLDLQQLEAGYQSLKLSNIQLQDWIPQVVEPFQRLAHSRQQSLNIDLSPNLPSLVSDPTSLGRILAELLNNACKYTPPTETITLKASTESDKLRLIVSNSGVEIPVQELPRIFQKFYRIPSGDPWKQGGTGLGLALLREWVSHLSGSIRVKSAAGQTCFTVELPLLAEGTAN